MFVAKLEFADVERQVGFAGLEEGAEMPRFSNDQKLSMFCV